MAASGVEHIEFPVLYARSIFRLGEIHDSLQAPDEARAAFTRFVALWQGGDLDRAEVARANQEIHAGRE